jgi:hypothetical protein
MVKVHEPRPGHPQYRLDTPFKEIPRFMMLEMSQDKTGRTTPGESA